MRAGICVAALLLAACNGQPAEETASAPEAVQSSKASMATPPAEASPATLAQAVTPPPPPADPLSVGSRGARDDLYCSALIYEENPDVSDALAPVDEALLRKAQMLGFIIGEAGINKLVEEKAAHATHAAIISDAYAALVEKDARAKKLRISLDECNRRAAALPVPQ